MVMCTFHTSAGPFLGVVADSFDDAVNVALITLSRDDIVGIEVTDRVLDITPF